MKRQTKSRMWESRLSGSERGRRRNRLALEGLLPTRQVAKYRRFTVFLKPLSVI